MYKASASQSAAHEITGGGDRSQINTETQSRANTSP